MQSTRESGLINGSKRLRASGTMKKPMASFVREMVRFKMAMMPFGTLLLLASLFHPLLFLRF